MTIDQYIQNINNRYKQGNATEHTFRGDLQQLLESIVPTIQATNEPKRQTCGAPDYILTKKDIPVGFIEAKDIGDKDLAGAKKTGNKEQFDRYKASLSNLIFTDYLDFHLYREGQLITTIAIGEISFPSDRGVAESRGVIKPLPQNFAAFENLIKDFCSHIGQTIKSSKKLAEMMAGKARLLSDVIEKALTSDEDSQLDSTLKEQMYAFKEILIHDITPKSFADVYAQTIAYGMFAARLHDPTLPTFSRQEAAELIPKSNPFLRKLFGYIAGPDIDDRITWIVDGLVEVFLACNVAELLKTYGRSTKTEDPIIHFYETFLSEYDPALRKARGVWYTPHPVVNFIVRAVDDILKTEFGLPMGLADTSKTTIQRKVYSKATADQRSKIKADTINEEVHRVQILDPATGTGTFLAEVVKHIHQQFEGMQGVWSQYVDEHLLPRLNGFELLMASYAMAHLQLDLLLTETGYSPLTPKGGTAAQRLRIYLTNSLEESHPDTGTLFANWLSTEANEANHIKRDTPVMCVIGNPPYAVSSTNKSPWIQGLIADYKKDLNERKINLDDDYIKFIRYGQHFIDKNGSGVLAYISNNSFIDGITHRQMRKHLLESFDTIYILDLHGNAKKKETAPDGSVDQNVFDIMQGVSINIFVKTGKKKKGELGQVLHLDLFGKRELKYDFLSKTNLKEINWNTLNNIKPNFFFILKEMEDFKDYENGFKIDEIFSTFVSGFQTKRDKVTINFSLSELAQIKKIFIDESENEIRRKLDLPEDGRDWTINWAKNDLKNNNPSPIKIMYRPFDERFTYYTGKSKGFIAYPRDNMYQNLKHVGNISLITCRQQSTFDFQHIFVSRLVSDMCNISSQTKETGYVFPLYLYPENNAQFAFGQPAAADLEGFKNLQGLARVPNLNADIVTAIASKIGLAFVADHAQIPDAFQVFVPAKDVDEPFVRPLDWGYKGCFTPLDLLDYIYAVLHSPTYREKYKEFLKIDFPRVPYPKDVDTFWQLVNLGGKLREIHLLESPVVNKRITQYPIGGDNKVVKPRFVMLTKEASAEKALTQTVRSFVPQDDSVPLGNVFINDLQHFANVPEVAWNFYIGGYQPAQKWLKDRKDRTLTFEDIIHYQKIIAALTETDRLMKEIDAIEIE
jgi:predicted helicase